ncbi:type IV secretion system protein [Kitasatospora sp. GAS1066B]|uniref:SCO6881 family protein n=1 Tax=Kitasatospora sp. GAS1066B TaxID=3156271 RepID=UPI0035135D08
MSGGIGDSITTSIGNWIAKSCGDLAQSAVDLASRAVDNTTSIDLNASWFRDNYAVVLSMSLVMLIMTFCFQLARAAWKRDGQALSQALMGTVSGVIFSFTAIAFTGVAITVVDALSKGLFQIANSSTSDAVRRIVKVSEIAMTNPLGWGIPAVVALGCAVGCFLYWGMMVFRKVSILSLVVLAPLAGAGGGWEPTRSWRQRWIEATATLVFSKLVMTIILLLGISALGETKSTDGLQALSDVIAGIVVMALVLLSPFAIYKFIHWAGDSQAHDMHRSMSAGLQVAQGAAKQAGSMAMGAGGAGKAAAIGSPQGPDRIPGMDAAGSNSSSGPTQTSFKFGAPTRSGGGDGGLPLITRPPAPPTDGDQGKPLITRPGTPTAGAAPAPASGGGSATRAGAIPATAAAAAGSGAPVAEASSRAPAGGSASPGPAFDPVIAAPPEPVKAPAASGAGRFTYPGPPAS